MKNKKIAIYIAISIILLFSKNNIYAQNNENLKISGDIVQVQYKLKKPIGLTITDKKIKFQEHDIIKEISYVNRGKSRELKSVDINGKKDVLSLYNLDDDLEIIAKVVREFKETTIYATIYDLRNVVWSDYYVKVQEITSVNEEDSTAYLNWVSYFDKYMIDNIKVCSCETPAVYKSKGEYKIISEGSTVSLLGEGVLDKNGFVISKIENLDNIKYIKEKPNLDNNLYMYIENIKDYNLTPYKIKIEENQEGKVFKKIVIDDDKFKQMFGTSKFKSGIEGSPIVQNGEIVGNIASILKVKNKYIIVAQFIK